MLNNYQHIKSSFADTARKLAPRKTLLQRLSSPVVSALLTPFLACSLAYGGNTDTKSIKPYNTKTPAVSYSHDELVLGDKRFIRKDLEDDEEIVFKDKNREEVVLSRKVTLGGKFIDTKNLEQVITKRKHSTAPVEEEKYHVLVALEGDVKTSLHADRDNEPNPTQISLETKTSKPKTTSKTTEYTSRNKTLRNAIALKGIKIDGTNLVVYPVGQNFTGLDKELSDAEPSLFLRTDGKWGYELITRITTNNIADALQGVHYVLTQVMIRKKLEQDKQEGDAGVTEISAKSVGNPTPTEPTRTLRNIFKRKPIELSVPITPETRQEAQSKEQEKAQEDTKAEEKTK